MLKQMKKWDELSLFVIIVVLALGIFVWYQVIFAGPAARPEIYFLDVGQGDAELVVLSGGVKIMTDAGPDQKVIKSIEKALSRGDKYIDIAIISHPQLDHFNGYNYLLDNYNFGAFIWNGRSDTKTVKEWPALLEKIKAKNIPLITLAAGDRVRYQSNEIDFLSPDKSFIQSAELNDTGFVELVKTSAFKTLLTADIGFSVEDYLTKQRTDLRADVFKVPHHGSKYSSGDTFLSAVSPKVAVIEVGEKNRYGHPTKEALSHLGASGAKIFRTDQNGNIKIFAENQKLKVFTNQ